MPHKKPVKRTVKEKNPHQTRDKEPTISFESKEFPHHAKNELWYLGIGLLLLIGLYLALRDHNYLLAAVVIAAGLAIFRIARLQPSSRKIEITPRGLYWGDSFYPYHQLKAFWISENAGQLTVYLERPNFTPVIHFTVPDNRVDDVLTALSLELPFHQHKNEPLGDRLNRLLRI